LIKDIFKESKENSYGVYCVRIGGDNGWKSIIIDDFIPVIETASNDLIPAFLNIRNKKEGTGRNNSL
jgi:hypothetical protein